MGDRRAPGRALTRFWFEFDFSGGEDAYGWYSLPACGCGITAFDAEDALRIMRRFLLHEPGLQRFGKVVENVDVSTLDPRDVLPNTGVPCWRGVWFPAFNLWYGPFREGVSHADAAPRTGMDVARGLSYDERRLFDRPTGRLQ